MLISEPVNNQNKTFALFELGFRPFFLLAGLSAFLLMVAWFSAFSAAFQPVEKIAPVYWHAHEMIFGFSAAVIAGFLLTAVKNWTGIQTLRKLPLILLSALWLVPRILYLSDVDMVWLAVIDLAFLPVLALAIACPVIKARQWNNFFFVPLILLMAVGNVVFYLQFLTGITQAAEWGLHLGLGVVLIIIAVMAGRVIGFFIARGLNANIRNLSWANQLALWGTVGFVAGQNFLPASLLSVVLMLASIGHIGRLFAWYYPGLWRVPLLWVLYLGYFWFTLGFVLSLLEVNGLIAETLAEHMFTVGAIGVITLGMMARVALGHTGREMQSHWLINLAFASINIAVIFRVILPLVMPDQISVWLHVAAIGWIFAFGCFALVYFPVLILSRVDGRPG